MSLDRRSREEIERYPSTVRKEVKHTHMLSRTHMSESHNNNKIKK